MFGWLRRKQVESKPVRSEDRVEVYRADDGWRYETLSGGKSDRARKQFVYTVRAARQEFPGLNVVRREHDGSTSQVGVV